MRSSWGDKAVKSPKGIVNVASPQMAFGVECWLVLFVQVHKKGF